MRQVREERAAMPLAPDDVRCRRDPAATFNAAPEARDPRRRPEVHAAGKAGPQGRTAGDRRQASADEAYDGAGEVYDLYFKAFGEATPSTIPA